MGHFNRKQKILLSILTILVLMGSSISIYVYDVKTTKFLTDINFQPDFSYDCLSNEIWKTPNIRTEGFLFEVQNLGSAPMTPESINESVIKYQLGETVNHHPAGTEIGEWGYSFQNLKDGALDGSGRAHYGGYPSPPENRIEALNVIQNYVLNLMGNDERPWSSFNGHYPYHHYAAEFGFDVIGSEIGENMNSYQMIMSFNRGAARQYNLPWFIDFSAWHSAGITDYSTTKYWGEFSGSNYGHSLSLYERSYFYSYMAGAGAVVAEAGGINFLLEEVDETGSWIPSPLGEIGAEFYNFTQRHADRGISYTPFGILLDYYHGTYMGNSASKKAFDHFRYNAGDKMTWDLFNLFFPGGWSQKNEVGTLTETPYGDSCDILIQNASLDVISSYPIIIPSGDIDFSEAEISRLISYVSNGGVLLLNTAYIDQFPESFISKPGFFDWVSIKSYGDGQIITYGPDFRVNWVGSNLLEELSEIFIPFSITLCDSAKKADVQYLLNRRENSWVVTIINNDGISKKPHDPPRIDDNEYRDLSIEYKGTESISSIIEWYTDTEISQNIKKMDISLEPGDIAIYEFQF